MGAARAGGRAAGEGCGWQSQLKESTERLQKVMDDKDTRDLIERCGAPCRSAWRGRAGRGGAAARRRKEILDKCGAIDNFTKRMVQHAEEGRLQVRGRRVALRTDGPRSLLVLLCDGRTSFGLRPTRQRVCFPVSTAVSARAVHLRPAHPAVCRQKNRFRRPFARAAPAG